MAGVFGRVAQAPGAWGLGSRQKLGPRDHPLAAARFRRVIARPARFDAKPEAPRRR